MKHLPDARCKYLNLVNAGRVANATCQFIVLNLAIYYGQIIAIDDNYYHFLYKEHPGFESGVSGGIGVFGSVNGETFKLHVVKEQN